MRGVVGRDLRSCRHVSGEAGQAFVDTCPCSAHDPPTGNSISGAPMFRQKVGPQAWLAGPMVVVASVLVWSVIDRALGLGPLDRAQATGFVAVPIFLLAPGASAWGLYGSTRQRQVALVAAQGFAAFAAISLSLDLLAHQIGCVPVTSGLDALPRAMLVGLVGGLGYSFSAAVALAINAQRRRLLAFIGGAICLSVLSLASVYVFFSLFPVASCPAP